MSLVQEVALRDIAYILDQHNSGWLSNTKPLVLLFTGPSRCGKTETAEQISKVISDQPVDPRCFLNMGQYQLEQDVAKLNGFGPGYVGSPDGALAFLDPSCRHVVILDEIEKAHTNALVLFLSVFDKGRFTTGAHKVIDCKSITSHQTFGDELLRPLFEDKGWRPEFWACIDMCVPFLPLSAEACITGARHSLQVS